MPKADAAWTRKRPTRLTDSLAPRARSVKARMRGGTAGTPHILHDRAGAREGLKGNAVKGDLPSNPRLSLQL